MSPHASAIPESVDVAVVGAGPAGCAVSALLGRAGHRVLLLDRAPVPRPRLCTHAIMPSGVPVLEELGVLPAIMAAGAQRWWGVRLSMEGTHIEADLPTQGAAAPYGLSLRRPALDPILFAAAAGSPGVTPRTGWAAVRPLVERGAVRGLLLRSPAGREHEVRSRIVVACDGRRSALLAAAGSATRALPNRHTAWIAYLDGIPEQERPKLEAFYRDGRSVSLLPADAGLRVAGVVAPGRTFSRDQAARYMLAVIRSFPELRDRASDARIVSPPVRVQGLRNAVRLATPPGLVAAGDASLQSDPAFGQGIAWALRGARRLAEVIDHGLKMQGGGPLRVPATAALEPLSVPLTLGMSIFSAIPPGSLVERLLVRSAARSPKTSALALRLAVGFATAAPDSGPRRSPRVFLRDALLPGHEGRRNDRFTQRTKRTSTGE